MECGGLKMNMISDLLKIIKTENGGKNCRKKEEQKGQKREGKHQII